MIKILLVGACGKMGRTIADCLSGDPDAKIAAGVDIAPGNTDVPVFKSLDEVTVSTDVLVDFSNPALLNDIIAYLTRTGMPAVLATTGYNDGQTAKIKALSATVPVFFSFNMSLGVNLLCSLAKRAAEILGSDFDVEIVEKHHNQKLDAPSGTAFMLADTINSVFGDGMHYEYDRHSKRAKRSRDEIGIHSIRGGTIVGEHDVIFAGRDEVVTLSHSASSKGVFAAGAVKAAKFMANKKPGLYDMNSIIACGQE